MMVGYEDTAEATPGYSAPEEVAEPVA